MTLLQYVNPGNQRTAVTRTGENTAGYTYDAIGQVIADQFGGLQGRILTYNIWVVAFIRSDPIQTLGHAQSWAAPGYMSNLNS